MINQIAGTSSTSYSALSDSPSATKKDSGVNQDQFLQLLVEQLKNQDPMNPTDSDKFMTELAQFSQLQEVVAIRQNLDTIVDQQTAGGSTKA